MSRLQLIQDNLTEGQTAIYLVQGIDDKTNDNVYAYISMDLEQIRSFLKSIYKSSDIDNFEELGEIIVEGHGEISSEIKAYMHEYFGAEQ